jgi:transcriptional regulator with XRE-family HTH domain
MNTQRRKAYRRLSHEPPPDVRALLRWAGLRAVDVERRAGMAPGSFQRVLAGRRGRRMGLPTAERLAKALGVPLGVFASALKRTLDDREEFRRRVREARLALLEAQLR